MHRGGKGRARRGAAGWLALTHTHAMNGTGSQSADGRPPLNKPEKERKEATGPPLTCLPETQAPLPPRDVLGGKSQEPRLDEMYYFKFVNKPQNLPRCSPRVGQCRSVRPRRRVRGRRGGVVRSLRVVAVAGHALAGLHHGLLHLLNRVVGLRLDVRKQAEIYRSWGGGGMNTLETPLPPAEVGWDSPRPLLGFGFLWYLSTLTVYSLRRALNPPGWFSI